MTGNQTRWLFYSAAAFNFLAAVILFAPSGIAATLGLQPAPVGGPYEAIMVAAIALFGIGYAWVGAKPAENRAIVKLGLLGKLAVPAVVYSYALAGEANLVFALLVSGDLLYSIFFVAFLRTSDK